MRARMPNPSLKRSGQQQDARPGLAVRGTFSPARAWPLASCRRRPRNRGTATAFSYRKEKAEPLLTLPWWKKWCLYRLLVLAPLPTDWHQPSRRKAVAAQRTSRTSAERSPETAQQAPGRVRVARRAASPVSGAATALRRAAKAIPAKPGRRFTYG